MTWGNIMAYIVKQIKSEELSISIQRFIYKSLIELKALNNYKYNVDNMPIKSIADKQLLLVCFRGEDPVGFMIGTKGNIPFDPTLTVISQLVLYSKFPKASHLLIGNFIDFGKRNANYISMCVGKFTNLKESSLKKLGFSKGDVEFFMEI